MSLARYAGRDSSCGLNDLVLEGELARDLLRHPAVMGGIAGAVGGHAQGAGAKHAGRRQGQVGRIDAAAIRDDQRGKRSELVFERGFRGLSDPPAGPRSLVPILFVLGVVVIVFELVVDILRRFALSFGAFRFLFFVIVFGVVAFELEWVDSGYP